MMGRDVKRDVLTGSVISPTERQSYTVPDPLQKSDFSNRQNRKTMPVCRDLITVTGQVQGVGFRPFVYRLAIDLKLTGSVKNTDFGAVIEAEGDVNTLQQFQQRLKSDLPAPGKIQSLKQQRVSANGSKQFEILASQDMRPMTLDKKANHSRTDIPTVRAQILPDLSTCPACLQDIFSAGNRRYCYPFTNCTHCGPRFSIITALPYDRGHTTMDTFTMCPTCGSEYNNPTQRWFHAQPNACPNCGPSLSFLSLEKGQRDDPLACAIDTLKKGKILALEGLGGFQLLVDAQNAQAIGHLRSRKGRPEKPFALMYPSLEAIRRDCDVSTAAAALLTSPQAPIVLLPRRRKSVQKRDEQHNPLALAEGIAPNNLLLGIMLPNTPLHHLLMQRYGTPLIATSGNLSSEPICIHPQEARWRLIALADAFLMHNRPIQRPVDDSVVQLVQEQPQVLRHARGYAPQVFESSYRLQMKGHLSSSLSLECSQIPSPNILAVGAHLKSAIAVSTGDEIMLSQHIGDLDTPQARGQLKKTVDDFLSLYGIEPDAIACDQHPDYASTQLAQTLATERNIPLIPVQHHYAHILSCMAEHNLQPPVMGIAWDGTGYGPDQTVWGGEFLKTTHQGFDRAAHFLPYYLPGGDACALEPRRSALGLLYSCYGEAAFEMTDLAPMQAFKEPQLVVLRKMLTNKINSPVTSSVGRMFDGIASLLNLQHIISFEGQAALTVEFAATQSPVKQSYPFVFIEGHAQPTLIDWRPMVKAIVEDLRSAVMAPVIAAKFHNTLADIIVEMARRAGIDQVVMAGGCFQNTHLSESVIRSLSAKGFTPYWPQRVPPNDGGLAVGQVIAAWQYLSAHTSAADTVAHKRGA